jgi:hypothetical protein
MDLKETYDKTTESIDLFTNRFNANISTRSNDMWQTISKTLKKLELDSSGNIKVNNANLKVLRTLRGDILKTIITPQYKKDLNKFLGGFDELKGINDTYYKAAASGLLNENKLVFKEVVNASIDATKNSLLEAGISNEIIKPVQNLLTRNVTTGGNFDDLATALKTEILGDKERLGGLERYTKQITKDSLQQFNANYNESVSYDLGFEFFYYHGAVKTTSRTYCLDLVTGGRWYHKKEIENTASQQWAGKIPGTNASTIFIYRGGYNCGHNWNGASTSVVPNSVVERAISKGYYKPKN